MSIDLSDCYLLITVAAAALATAAAVVTAVVAAVVAAGDDDTDKLWRDSWCKTTADLTSSSGF